MPDRILRYYLTVTKNKPGKTWQRLKTHCPHGHPYDEENTRYTKKGHRQCRTCMRERNRSQTRSCGYYVKGWRDQECPVCGLKWFVDASSHISLKHGLRMRGLVSESRRLNSAALLTDLNQFDCDPVAVRKRHRRWAETIMREQARGGEYVPRLAKLWRLTKAGTEGRIAVVRREGLIPPRPGRTLREECRRGHPYNEENARYTPDGRRQCRLCVNLVRQLRRKD